MLVVELHKEEKIRGTFYLALFFSESNNLEGKGLELFWYSL